MAYEKMKMSPKMKAPKNQPKIKKEATKFDAYMCVNGMKAQEFGRKLTKGLDKSEYPVK